MNRTLHDLPQPSADALAHSARLSEHIRRAIAAAGGRLAFSRYMELALYAPGLGYYSAGARKLGRDGDFITAPEMTPLFGHVLARQVAELFQRIFKTAPRAVLEVGAGSGALAASLLEALEKLGALPDQYLILELSADLRERSRDTLAARVPHLLERVAWLNQLPPAFSGVVLGNEVLDAMPVEVFRIAENGIEEAGVVAASDNDNVDGDNVDGDNADGDNANRDFAWSWRAAPAALAACVNAAVTPLGLAPGYLSEVSLAAAGFLRSLAGVLQQGVAIFIDYGFPRREYYHAQRGEGTLMCHYRHRAHADPFFLPGLQDITAHVDFTAVADAAIAGGMTVLGYTSQAQFLINCGITDLLSAQLPREDDGQATQGQATVGQATVGQATVGQATVGQATVGQAAYLAASNAAQRLLSPAEMGELFKVIALGKGVDPPLLGFLQGDKTDTL